MQFASKTSVLLRPWQVAAPCQEEMAGGAQEQGRRDRGTALEQGLRVQLSGAGQEGERLSNGLLVTVGQDEGFTEPTPQQRHGVGIDEGSCIHGDSPAQW